MTSTVRLAMALVTVAAISTSCRQRVDGGALRGEAACAALDSLFAAAGPPRPLSASGDVVMDIEQFRFRGNFQLESSSRDDVALQLGGSTLFGGHREDIAVSLVEDTLRAFDRERARVYEGADLDRLIWDETKARADWAAVVATVFGGRPCASVEELVIDEDGARGTEPGGAFRVWIEGGKVTRAAWPDPTGARTFADRLEVRYLWRDARLEEISASLPERGWRVRFRVAKVPSVK